MKTKFLVVALLLFPLAAAFSQQPGPDMPAGPVQQSGRMVMGDPPQRQGPGMGMRDPQIRKQLEQIKIWQMTKEMNLPTAKAEKFFPLYNRYNDEMRAVTAERRQAVKSLDSTLNNHPKDSEIDGQIKHVLRLDDQLAATHVKFIKSLGDILSPTEVARYMVFEQRFDREIRERIRMMMMQRGMRGPGR